MLQLSGQTKALIVEPIRELTETRSIEVIEGKQQQQQQQQSSIAVALSADSTASSAGGALVAAEQAQSSFVDSRNRSRSCGCGCINESLSLGACKLDHANNVVALDNVCSSNDGSKPDDGAVEGSSDGEDGNNKNNNNGDDDDDDDDDDGNKHHDYANIATNNNNNNTTTELPLLEKPAQHQLQHPYQPDEDQQNDLQATSLFSKNYHHNISKTTATTRSKKKTLTLKGTLKSEATNYQVNKSSSFVATCCYDSIETDKNQKRKQKKKVKLIEDFNFISGKALLSNCSRKRRQSKVASLIELFEQKISQNELTTKYFSLLNQNKQQQQQQPTWNRKNFCKGKISQLVESNRKSSRERKVISTKSSPAVRTVIKDFEQLTKLLNKQQPQLDLKEERMRDIITPVKYDPATTTSTSTSTSTNTEEEEEIYENYGAVDSLDYCNEAKCQERISTNDVCNNNNINDHFIVRGEEDRGSKLHHNATKGLPVYSSKLKANKFTRKLVKTNWQPPTNGRQYEQKLKKPICHYQGNNGENFFIENYSDNNKEFYNKNCNNKATTRYSNSLDTGTRGPPIIKHQPSSSKRLLNQLARLRKLSEPNYRVKRPEKVAKVEALIEQLERATSEWEEDELLLDRAERRDWPSKYYELYLTNKDNNYKQSDDYNHHDENRQELIFADNNNSLVETKIKTRTRTREEEEEDEEEDEDEEKLRSLENLSLSDSSRYFEEKSVEELEALRPIGRRVHVDPIETETIARSHSIINNLQMMNGVQYRSGSSTWTANSLIGRRPSAFADRYFDDQAVRRLRRASLSTNVWSMSKNQNNLLYSSNQSMPRTLHDNQSLQMSYLLCSNAYTPTIDSNTCSPYDTLDDRIRNDDLHFRNIRTKPEPNEPPFGIPKQEASASAHSVASHYLRRASQATTKANQKSPQLATCSACNCVYHLQYQKTPSLTNILDGQQQQKRTDSKVSFVCDAASGRISADSGVVGGGSSPISAGYQSSPTSRLTLNSPNQSCSSRLSLTSKKQLCDSSSQTVDCEIYALDDDLTEEIDLGEREFGKDNWTSNKDQSHIDGQWETRELQDRGSSCESPMLEHHKAEILPKPIRQRPIFKVHSPQPNERSATKELLTKPKLTNKDLEGQLKTTNNINTKVPIVKIQCYEDEHPLSNTMNKFLNDRPISEVECKYDFTDEDDDDYEYDRMTTYLSRKSGTTNLESSQTNSETNESSIDKSEGPNNSCKKEGCANAIKSPTTNKEGPIFSIGEYKSQKNRNLIFI